MRKLFCTLLFCMLLFVFQNVYAQKNTPRFEFITTKNGLSHNKVQCVLQDRQGYLWFGTLYGLNRYDGYNFKVFQSVPGDTLSLINNDIVALYQDKNDLIWIGTSTNIATFNPKTESFTNYNASAFKGMVHHFEEDKKGVLWIAASNGLFSFDRQSKHENFYATSTTGKDNVQYILQDDDERILWLATQAGIKKFDKQKGVVATYAIEAPAFDDIYEEITHSLSKDNDGNIWMTTSAQGVFELQISSGKMINYNVNPGGSNSLKSSITTCLFQDDSGVMWVGTEGVALLHANNNFEYYSLQNNNEKITNKTRCILKDRSGIYWLGTEAGIAKYDPKLYSFTTINPDYPYTLQSANTIVEDNDHKFWVGNYIGLGSVDTATGIYTNENDVIGANNAKPFIYSSALAKDGSLWFGSLGCLYHVIKQGNGNATAFDKITLPLDNKASVSKLAFDAQQTLWIGTKNGYLYKYAPLAKTIKLYTPADIFKDAVTTTGISCLLPLPQDKLLIGSEGKGLVVMQIQTEKFETVNLTSNATTSITYNAIANCLALDTKGQVWIGTDNNGLWQTDTDLKHFKNYSVKDGLHSMNILQAVIDKEDHVWLNTNLGVEIVDASKNRFIHFSEEDGLSVNQPGYLLKQSSGDILRVDLNGLHIFHPSTIYANKTQPPVYINHIQVLDKSIPIYKDTVIHLAYYQNYLSFDFVALNFTQSFKNRYAYKLEGLDFTWINSGDRRFASYANISPGTYTFLVKAANNNGVWTDHPARLTLIIAPPWWSTWWFYTLCACLVAALLYFLFQFRLKQKLKAYEIRNTISRDLHDEVGSTLSSINFISSMALNDADGNTKAHSALTTITESSHQMLDAMNDIIWNIQPENDTLQNINVRMLSFASELLEARNIHLHYHVNENIKNLNLGITVRHDFFVIFKEAVNNLAKYSQATEAFIQLEYIAPYVVLSIRDNGKGFKVEKLTRINGLKNMENRAKKIGALLKIATVEGEGTTITLQVKPT